MRAAANSIAKAIPSSRLADLRDRIEVVEVIDGEVLPDGTGPLDEQRDGCRSATDPDIEWRHRPGDLATESQRLARRGDHTDRCRPREDDVDQRRGRVEDVLAVVEHDQQPSTSEGRSQALGDGQADLGGDSQPGGYRVGHSGWIPDGGKFHEPHAVGELRRQLGGDLHCQTGLADPTDPDQRHQPMSGNQVAELGDLGVPTDEAGRLNRKVARDGVDRPERGKSTRRPAART